MKMNRYIKICFEFFNKAVCIVWQKKVCHILDTDVVCTHFNKSFCKRYNGEQLVVVLQNSDNDNKEYGFVVDSKENVISFTI